MKKVTRKGAYAKAVKKQMMMRRAPLVETKKRVNSDIDLRNGYAANGSNTLNSLNFRLLPYGEDKGYTAIPLTPWTRMKQGLEQDMMIGDSVFSKYLTVKVQMRFPRGEQVTVVNNAGIEYTTFNQYIENPSKIYLICGWVTKDWGLPLVPLNANNPLVASEATSANLAEYIESQVKPYFNDDEDKLNFRPKDRSNIQIESYRRFKPDLAHAIPTQAFPGRTNSDGTTHAGHGSIPDVTMTHTFKPMRKITYRQGVDDLPNTEDGAPAPAEQDLQNMYPNDSWVPFCVIYNPDYQMQRLQWVQDPQDSSKFTSISLPQYRYNVCHYYTDG